jgi:hypothetical protein
VGGRNERPKNVYGNGVRPEAIKAYQIAAGASDDSGRDATSIVAGTQSVN